MKSIYKVLIAIAFVLILIGYYFIEQSFINKLYTLDCSKNVDLDGFKATDHLIYSYKGSNLQEFNLRRDIDLSDYSDYEIRITVSQYNLCDKFKDIDVGKNLVFKDCKQEVNGKIISLYSSYDFNEGVNPKDFGTYVARKKMLDKNKYNCNIKEGD